MRHTPFALLPCLVFASASLAQPTADDCIGVTRVAPPDGDPPEPGFGGVSLLSPQPGALSVPRNVEIRLSGDVNTLAVEPAQMRVQVQDALGARVPFARVGLTLTPLEPLQARQTFLVRIEATEANPCPECFGVQESSFTTGDDVDVSAPILTGPLPVHVFVMPSDEEAARCGMFFGQTHQIVVDFGPAFPLDTWINVAGKKEGGSALDLFDIFNGGLSFPASSSIGNTVPTGLGDAFFIAITPRDLAGNVGASRTVRVRARSFIDMNRPREELAPLSCDMPALPTVMAATPLPTNGQLAIEFPFEEVPLALQHGDQLIPLLATSDLSSGHVYQAAEPLPAGESLLLVPLPCPSCLCSGCGDFAAIPIIIGDSSDNTPPAPPIVRELREDADPEFAVEGQCHPDRAALVVILQPGQDDQANPLELRYDANIRIDGGPQLVLGRSVVPLARGDGSIALRIETAGFGRLLDENIELTLQAIDAAGNRASAVTSHGDDDGAGCTASGAGPACGLALLALVVRRRSAARARSCSRDRAMRMPVAAPRRQAR